MNQPIAHYKNHRFPPEIIARAIWLYYRFPLSLRHVEEMLLERGIVVSYETIRRWGRKHGPEYARRICRKPPSSDDVWHLDEVAVRINGRQCWLWRAVDQDGFALDEIVQNRRNTKAARRLLIRLMKKQGMVPKRMITDKLRSYGAARLQVIPDVEHRSQQMFEQSSREFACSVSKTRANAPILSIDRQLAAFCFRLLCCSQSLCSVPYKSLSISDPKLPPAGHG